MEPPRIEHRAHRAQHSSRGAGEARSRNTRKRPWFAGEIQLACVVVCVLDACWSGEPIEGGAEEHRKKYVEECAGARIEEHPEEYTEECVQKCFDRYGQQEFFVQCSGFFRKEEIQSCSISYLTKKSACTCWRMKAFCC